MQQTVAAPDIKVGDVVWQTEGMPAAEVLGVETFVGHAGTMMYRVVIGNSRGVAVTMELHPENVLTYQVKGENTR